MHAQISIVFLTQTNTAEIGGDGNEKDLRVLKLPVSGSLFKGIRLVQGEPYNKYPPSFSLYVHGERIMESMVWPPDKGEREATMNGGKRVEYFGGEKK